MKLISSVHLWSKITITVVLLAVVSSCAISRNGSPSAKEANKSVLVTIEGEVNFPGEYQIPRNCNQETIRQKVGGWTVPAGVFKSLYLYRNVDGVTNRSKLYFFDKSGKSESVTFENGDRISVKEIYW